MPVVAADVKFYQSSHGASEGGAISGTEIVSGSANNLWPDISPADALAGGMYTRKWFMTNTNGVDALAAFSLWIDTVPTGTTEQLALGFDDANDDDGGDLIMTAFGASDVVSLISDGLDSRVVTIYGLDGAGAALVEAVTLTDNVEVLSVGTFSEVYAAHADSPDGARTITVAQGAGGTTRGTIEPNDVMCALLIDAGSKPAGLLLVALAAGASIGVWDQLSWPPATGPVDPNSSVIAVELV